MLEDLDQAQHLSAAFAQNPIDLRLLQLGTSSARADLVIMDTAPEADRPRRRDQRMAQRAIAAMERLAATDQGDVTRLRGVDPPEWRLRVGD